MKNWQLAAFAALLSLAFASPAAAADYRSGAVGGSGGAAFSSRCPQGSYLVGFRARAGNWVDAITPLCARWDAGRQAFAAPSPGGSFGGPGGGQAEIRCTSRAAVQSLTVETAPNEFGNLALLVPTCVTAQAPMKTATRIGPDQLGTSIGDRIDRAAPDGLGSSTAVDYDRSKMPHCRSGDLAVGVYGAAGNFVDRLGLICAPAPPPPLILPPKLPVVTSPAGRVQGAGKIVGPAQGDQRRCRPGFVWREASPSDFVCVTPESRARVRQENVSAPSRRSSMSNVCLQGFVWREAFQGDQVCVSPEVRAQVRQENAQAVSRTDR